MALTSAFSSILSNSTMIWSTSSSRLVLLSVRFSAISLYFCGSVYRNPRSSSSHLNCQIPNLFAIGANMSNVSWAILRCLSEGRALSVRILCKRSASIITTTRTSSPIARSIFRIVSAKSSLILLASPGVTSLRGLRSFSC